MPSIMSSVVPLLLVFNAIESAISYYQQPLRGGADVTAGYLTTSSPHRHTVASDDVTTGYVSTASPHRHTVSSDDAIIHHNTGLDFYTARGGRQGKRKFLIN